MGAMMAARYAEVAVDAPLPPERTLTYAIPPGMSVAPGQAVWAPLQSRRVSGVVFSLADHTEIDGVRFLGGVQDAAFALSPAQLALARWLSRETLCSLYEAAALMLPWDFRRRLLSLLRTTDKAEGADLSQRSDEERRLLARLHRTKLADERRLVRSAASRTALRRLMREGLVVREWRWERPRATPQYRATLRLAVSAEEARRHADDLPDASRRQKDLLEYLAGTPSIDRTAARKEFGASAVDALERRGLVAVEQRRHLRDPLAGALDSPTGAPAPHGPAGRGCRGHRVVPPARTPSAHPEPVEGSCEGRNLDRARGARLAPWGRGRRNSGG